MDLGLHTNAIDAFNEKAENLVTLVERGSVNQHSGNVSPLFDTEPYISTNIAEADIAGPIFGKTEYDDGRFSHATLITDKQKLELHEAGCTALIALTESIWRAGNVASLVKKSFIDRAFFDWINSKTSGKYRNFIGYLQSAINSSVEPCKVLVPLHQVRSSVRFRLLDCLVREVSGSEVNSWFPGESVDAHVIELKKLVQGYCVIEIELVAEPDHAATEALRMAGVITSLLALHSLAGITLSARFNGVPIGQEDAQSYTAIVFTPGSSEPIVQQGFLSSADKRPFLLDEKRLDLMGQNGLREMSELFNSGKKTEFEVKVRDAVSTFSRASLTRSTSEKLVFGVVAMESLFIANESEPIGQNLADRLAMLLGESIEDRKKYAGNVKKAYVLRSKYVHHGKSAEDSKVISEFLMLGFFALVKSVIATCEFDTKAKFLNSLDDLKYAG